MCHVTLTCHVYDLTHVWRWGMMVEPTGLASQWPLFKMTFQGLYVWNHWKLDSIFGEKKTMLNFQAQIRYFVGQLGHLHLCLWQQNQILWQVVRNCSNNFQPCSWRPKSDVLTGMQDFSTCVCGNTIGCFWQDVQMIARCVRGDKYFTGWVSI